MYFSVTTFAVRSVASGEDGRVGRRRPPPAMGEPERHGEGEHLRRATGVDEGHPVGRHGGVGWRRGRCAAQRRRLAGQDLLQAGGEAEDDGLGADQ